MSNLPKDRTEVAFRDYKEPYDANQALAEANRCLYCADAPCIQACPTSIDIPTFIRKIATENTWGSAKTIFEANILGMSCARVCPVEVLCVGDCVYNEMGIEPIQIGKLQRYATDMAFDEGWQYFQAGPDTGKSVALIGGGPASLAAAHLLRRLGHACTVFEKHEYLGGLNANGVAPYKMKADRAMEEVDWILSIGGIDVRTGIEVGKDITWEDIERDFDAVFLGMGLGPDKYLNVPGEELTGVYGAVDWIAKMKVGHVDIAGVKHAVVIGGGNTALDCVRELAQLNIENVTMVYRGTEEAMSGYAHEWDSAKREGATALWRAVPMQYEGESGVRGVRCQRLDAKKVPIPGEEATIPADLVLIAVGQSKLGGLLEKVDGITVEWGTIVVDETGATGRPGWFAGGDGSNGAKEVVNAAAEGKLAAESIHAYLMGGESNA